MTDHSRKKAISVQNGSPEGKGPRRPLRWLDTAVPYNHKLRRRLRAAGYLASSVFDPRCYPAAPVVNAFWFDDIANFGDQLTPWLLRRSGAVPIRTAPERANLCGVGSILHLLPSDFHGEVWGSGLISEHPVDLPNARWLAVRGHLTRDLVGAPSRTAVGDPGLLASRYLARSRPGGHIGVVPHHVHLHDPLWGNLARQYPNDVAVIDVRRKPSSVIRDISACTAVLTTSLHGLVVADSYGIPAAWAEGLVPLMGKDFKFRDYLSAVGGPSRRIDLSDIKKVDNVLNAARSVDAERVQKVQEALLTALHSSSAPRMIAPRALLQSLHGPVAS